MLLFLDTKQISMSVIYLLDLSLSRSIVLPSYADILKYHQAGRPQS